MRNLGGLISLTPAAIGLLPVAVTVGLISLTCFFEVGLALGVGVGSDPVMVVGFRGFTAESVSLKAGNFLAYEMKGHPLPMQHGFPQQAVFPGMPGGRWVKWLLEIRVE